MDHLFDLSANVDHHLALKIKPGSVNRIGFPRFRYSFGQCLSTNRLATSTDAKVWTNVQDEPVMRPGPDAYDREFVAVNQILKTNDRYYIYYHGYGKSVGNWTTNVATSTDLLHWKKYDNNPLLPAESNKSSGILVHDGTRYRLYTMHGEVQVHYPRGQRREGF